MRFEIFPQKGVQIDNYFIELGMKKSDLNMRYPMDSYDDVYYLFDSSLQLHIKDDRIMEITCYIGNNTTIYPMCNGEDLTKLDVESMVSFLNEILKEEAEITEEAHSYTWCCAGVSCWRELTPKEVEESIIEAKEDGIYKKMKAKLEQDVLAAKYFETITLTK